MPINYLENATNLPEYLRLVSSAREKWGKKEVNFYGENVTRKGEEEALWFRGQVANAGLSPKLWRKAYEEADEAEIRQQFQSRALQLMQGRVPDPDSIWDWYFLMQHYGAPTRLLDWTDNPLVALFFAVKSSLGGGTPGWSSIQTCPRCGANCEFSDNDGAVWIIDPYWLNHGLFPDLDGPLLPDWDEADKYLKPLQTAFEDNLETRMMRPAAIDPPHVDRRLAVQGSHFVIFGQSKDLTKSRLVRKKKCRLAKIVIPKEALRVIQGDLEDVGITHSSIFPDLEALGEELASFWKVRQQIPGNFRPKGRSGSAKPRTPAKAR